MTCWQVPCTHRLANIWYGHHLIVRMGTLPFKHARGTGSTHMHALPPHLHHCRAMIGQG